MTSGLLLDGKLFDVPGLTIVPPASHGGPAWNQLHVGDYMARKLALSILELHTTGGRWPQPIIPGAGRRGHAEQILKMWSGQDRGGGEKIHSAAPIVIDFDGVIYCAGDLMRGAAYHSELLNQRAGGIELCTRPDGGIHQATLTAGALFVAALTYSGVGAVNGLLPIPFQMPGGPYRNAPLRRLELGGKQTDGAGLVGVIGHRDQTANRGFGDPGDAIWRELAALGCEGVDYAGEEDLVLGRRRQAALNAADAKAGRTFRPLVVDGVVGPASIATARRQGYTRWRDVGMAERAA